jgi:predicted helicase
MAEIFYHDIGDYLSREDKLAILKNFRTIYNPDIAWQRLTPNENGDWINQRNDVFSTLIPLAPEKKFDTKAQSFFTTYAIGVATNRDAWVYSFSKTALESNMKRMIDFYNDQRKAYIKAKVKNAELSIEDFIDNDTTNISWTRALRKDAAKNISHSYNKNIFIKGIYRPFCLQNLYFDLPFIEAPGINNKLFPTPCHANLLICVSGIGSTKPFTSLITNTIPCLDLVDKSQCFPLYYYEEANKQNQSLFDADKTEYIRRDGVSDFIFTRAKTQYGKNVTKEDVFYYVYGFLHSPDYRKQFGNDLKKMLPRLPLIDSPKDFWAFSKAGRNLADLHLNYETVPPCPDVTVSGAESGSFNVEQMRFPKGQKARDCPDTILYNSKITVLDIPAKAYEYIVNGKSAIEWLMERYAVTVHKESDIRNDPNDWAKEHDAPRYILDLLLSVINVSVQTVEFVNNLPKIEFEEIIGDNK